MKMKFRDINFYDHSGSDRSGPGLYLPGGYWVPRSDFVLVWNQVRKGLPPVGCTDERTTKSMCGVEFWSPLKCGKKLAIGRCVKFFVANKILPLKLANRGKGASRKYVRVDPVQAHCVQSEVIGSDPAANLKNDFVNVRRAENQIGETK